MRFMTLVKYDENGTPPPRAYLDALAQFGRAATAAGAMVERGGLQPSGTGSRIRLSNGKVTVTDGPFTEVKELIGGYAIYDVRSKQEAIEWITRFVGLSKEHWPEWECEVEIRQILEG
jgi:hypothetical protein